jgi:hypothetical protein
MCHLVICKFYTMYMRYAMYTFTQYICNQEPWGVVKEVKLPLVGYAAGSSSA